MSALLAFSCDAGAKRAPVIVRNPQYIVVRSIRRNADAEHTLRVQLPYAGASYGYAATTPLLDLNSINIEEATFAGGRTSIVGEAAIWLPLKPEASQRLQDWSARHAGDYLGIFLKGKLVAAPQATAYAGGGIPLRVPSKAEGDVVIREMRDGGATQ